MNKLLTLTNIRPGEGRVVAWVLLYGTLTEMINVIVYTATYALFLNAFDAQRLPYIYIGASIVTTIFSLLSLQLSRRYSLAQVLFGQLSFILVTLIGYRLGLIYITGSWFIFSLPILYGVINSFFFAAFWNLLGRLFNLQQGKRLFSLLGAGQQVAGLTVGFLIPALVVWLGTANLLWLATVAVGGQLWLLLHLTRRYSGLRIVASDDEAPPGEAQLPRRNLLADPYIQLIFAMYLFFGLGDYFVDNIFYTQVESQFTNQNQLASFLGVFSGVVAGVSLFSQLFIANWLLRRYGVRTAIVLTPLLLLVGIALFTLTGLVSQATLLLFWLTTAINLTRYVTDATDNTAANLLYQPLPATARTTLQTSIDGILYPVAAGMAGLLLLWLTNGLHFTSLQLAYVLLPILAVWTAVAFSLGRLYPQRVQQALRQRLFQGVDTFRPDRASLESIRLNLTNPHPGAVIYALAVLESMDTAELTQVLPTLLQHPSVPVRLEVLLRLERIGGTGAWSAIRHTFHADPDPAVRMAALRTLATLGGVEHFEEVYEHLVAADPQLQQGAMVGLLRSGELEGILAAGGMLSEWVNSALPADRILAAQVLGESEIVSFYRPLLKLLSDPDPQVQRAALLAAGKLQQPKLWPAVIVGLAALPTRSAAQAALVAGGAATLPALKAALERVAAAGALATYYDHQLHLALVRVCGRIRTPEAVQLLLPHLHFPDFQVRTQTLHMLQQCGYQADAATRPYIVAQIEAELAQTAWILASLVDLTVADAPSLLSSTLEESLNQQRTHLLLWLSLLYAAPTMQRVRTAFRTAYTARRQTGADAAQERVKLIDAGEAEQRAYALETIDVLVAKPITKHLLPLLDDLPPEEQLKRLGVDFPQPVLTVSERLLAMITGADERVNPWLKAVTLYTAARLPWPADSRAILHTAALRLTEDPLSAAVVQETAQWMLATLRAAEQTSPLDQLDLKREKTMLLTIEKVLILKTVDLFARAPDEILMAIAGLLKEVEMPAGATIFVKGEQGESMYIIVGGEVEARDGDRVFTRMGERQIFGEMALLDGEPRTATICTTQPTHLLRLDQEPFYELMDDHIEIARGVIHVLLQRLRARTEDLNRLRAQPEARLNEQVRKPEAPLNEQVRKPEAHLNEQVRKPEAPLNEQVRKPEAPLNEQVCKSEAP